MNALREQFNLIDKEHLGYISYDEFVCCMEKFGFRTTCQDFDVLLENLQSDTSLGINYSDFLSATLDCKKYLTDPKLLSLFKYFDVDGDDRITADNLREVMAREGRKLPECEIELMLDEADLQHNHVITFD